MENLTILLGSIVLAMGSWIAGNWNKVSEKECDGRMTELDMEHDRACPQNRALMTEADHDRVCDYKLKPLHDTLEEIKQLGKDSNSKIDTLAVMVARQEEQIEILRHCS